MGVEIVDRDTEIKIPASVAVCPICGAEVFIEDIDEYDTDDQGLWRATDAGVKIDCVTVPDIGSDEWEDWFASHWLMPYVDWLPVSVKVSRWMGEHYRFNLVVRHA